MTITIKNQKFQAAVHHKGQRWRKTFDSRDEALRWETSTKLKAIDGRPVSTTVYTAEPDSPTTLAEMIEYTNTHCWHDCKSGKGLYQNALMVGDVIGMDTQVTGIDRLDLDSAVAFFLEQNNSNATINRKMAAISRVLRTAVEIGVIKAKPSVRRLRENPHRIRWYDLNELLVILDAAARGTHPQFAHFLGFLANTGVRLSEALNLTWADVDSRETPLQILISDSKTNTQRTIPLNKAARDRINAMDIHQRLNKDRSVHESVGPFSYLKKHHIRAMWQQTKDRAGLVEDSDALIHTFRHTFISHLVRAGVPLTVVRELAGHKTMEMTLRYAHLAPRDLQNAVAQIHL